MTAAACIPPLALNTALLGNRPFVEKIDAAARSGFRGIEMFAHEAAPHLLSESDERQGRRRFGFEPTRETLTPRKLADMARDRALSVEGLIPGTDVMLRWTGRFDEEIGAQLAATIAVCAKLGGRYVVLPTVAETGSIDQVARNLRELAPIARDHRVQLGLEPIGQTSVVNTVADAQAVLDLAGLDELAGLVLDTFHFFRARQVLADLASLDPARIVAVQINDALPLPLDTLVGGRHRTMPGRGVFDVVGFCDAVLALGYDGPFVVEVLNPDIALGPMADTSVEAFATASAVLANAVRRQSVSVGA